MIIFSSFAFIRISGNGGLNFLGERQIQSHVPVSGEEPEVSIFTAKPSFFNSEVNSSRLYKVGSPPVITASLAAFSFAFATIFSMLCSGYFSSSQLSFTSHHTQPTSQPARRIKYAAFPWWKPSP